MPKLRKNDSGRLKGVDRVIAQAYGAYPTHGEHPRRTWQRLRAAISIPWGDHIFHGQSQAAKALSDTLSNLGCPHAYIGGFAWALLGSERPTQDIDVLIEARNHNISEIRDKLSAVSKQFAKAGLKLYYVKNSELKDDLTGDELVKASKDNVLIETLQTGMLGLPKVVEPKYSVTNEVTGIVLEILHPGVLFLTKLKRWYLSRESDYPKAILKVASDRNDLEYLVYWLAENVMTIEFEKYEGKTKEQLRVYVKAFKEVCDENGDLMDALQRAMKVEDWHAITGCGGSRIDEEPEMSVPL